MLLTFSEFVVYEKLRHTECPSRFDPSLKTKFCHSELSDLCGAPAVAPLRVARRQSPRQPRVRKRRRTLPTACTTCSRLDAFCAAHSPGLRQLLGSRQ